MELRPLTVAGQGVTLDGQIYLPDTGPMGTVVVCHGLPKGGEDPDKENDPGYPALAARFVKEGFVVVLFNFRGTGNSTGSLEPAKWPQDLSDVLDWVVHNNPAGQSGRHFAVIGFSAGGAAAICAAALDDRIDPLICMAAPADFGFLQIEGNEELLFSHYRQAGMILDDYDKSPEEWVLNFSALSAKKCIDCVKSRRAFFVHGTEDDTVPVIHAELLAGKFPGKSKLLLIEGAGHRLRLDERAVEAAVFYLNECLRGNEND